MVFTVNSRSVGIVTAHYAQEALEKISVRTNRRPGIDKVRSADVARYSSPALRKFETRQENARHNRPSLGGTDVASFIRNESANGGAGDKNMAPYKPEFSHIAKTLCAMGADNAVLAAAFKVTVDTIVDWRSVHEEFSQACEIGEEFAIDGVEGSLLKVEGSLLKMANGYEYDVEKIFHHQGRTVVATCHKYVPADLEAAKFLLLNRRPDRWSNNPKPYDADHETPLAELARELAGTALRPKQP